MSTIHCKWKHFPIINQPHWYNKRQNKRLNKYLINYFIWSAPILYEMGHWIWRSQSLIINVALYWWCFTAWHMKACWLTVCVWCTSGLVVEKEAIQSCAALIVWKKHKVSSESPPFQAITCLNCCPWANSSEKKIVYPKAIAALNVIWSITPSLHS